MEKLYKTGFALSGGFIKGFAHLGAVQALYETGIRPDIISGVSAGALAGVLLADGRQPREILALFADRDFHDFTRFAVRVRGGLMHLDLLHKFLEENLSVSKIEDLGIPFVVTATDLDKGLCVHFTEGEIAPRIAASCCVPGLFSPVHLEGAYHVDGGVFMNLPVSTIRSMCDKVVAVNLSPIVAKEYKMGIKSILMRAYHFMSNSNSMPDRRLADILIEPSNLGSYGNTELHKGEEIFNNGYEAAMKVLDHVKDIVFPPEQKITSMGKDF